MDCASVLDVEHGIVIVGDLLHRKLTTLEELPSARRSWSGGRAA